MSTHIIPPVCISCQSNIGDKYPIFTEIRKDRIESICEKEGYKPYDSGALEGIEMGDVLDKLFITNICCRKSMLGFVSTISLH